MPYPGYEPQSEVSKAAYRGLAEGEVTGRRHSLRLVLGARGIALSDEQQEAIDSCSDQDQLDDWIRRAAVIHQADQLFGPSSN